MKIIYIADDGRRFNDSWECEEYEWKQNHKLLEKVECYDHEGKRIYGDITDSVFYNHVHKLIISRYDILEQIKDVYDFAGFYKEIDSIGTWIWNEDKEKFIKTKGE